MSKTSITFAVFFLGALIFSAYLFLENYWLKTELEMCSQTEKILVEQRKFLFELIPELEPEVTKKQLADIIKAKYPNEQVNELDDLVQWRFFHFWFDKKGKLESVQYAS